MKIKAAPVLGAAFLMASGRGVEYFNVFLIIFHAVHFRA
jgi:hypothetical protein